jgi:hypothetical protein
MKRLIFVLLVLMGLGGYAQVVNDGTKSRYPNRTEVNAAFGTKVGQDSLRTTMPLKLNSDSAAIKYVNKLTDGFVLTDTFYTEPEVDALINLCVATYNPSPIFQYMNMFPNLQTIGVPLFSTNLGTSSAYTLVDSRSVGVLIYIPKDTTLTGFKTYITTQGVYVPDNYNGFKIYSVSGSTATAVTGGETTNDTADPNIWEATATTVVTKALPTPISITKGLYLVCALWNTSDVSPTAPALGATASIPTTTTVFGDLKVASIRSTQTSFASPDDIATRTSIPQVVFIWLY